MLGGRTKFGRLGMCFMADDDLEGGTDINIDFGGSDDGDGDGGGDGNEFIIPDEYKDRDYAKGLKSNDDVWKMLDNAQKKIGEKTIVAGIPGENATEDEIKQFNKLFGVPEKAEDYKLESDEKLKAMYGDDDKAVLGQFKELLFKAGANEKQAAILKDGYNEIVGNIYKGLQDKQAEADKQFNELVTKTFGDRQDEVLNNAKKLINDFAPEGFKDQMAKLSSENLVVMAGVLDRIKEKYIDEDTLDRGANNTGTTKEEVRRDIQKVIGSDAFRNPMHAEHETAKAEYLRLAGVLDSFNN